MSRVSLLEQIYKKHNDAFGFNYDALSAPRIYDLLTPTDVGDLNHIATSLRYNANIEKKYKLIDEIFKRRGFRFAFRGTNRAVYNFLDYPIFVAKTALDRVGMQDAPSEFKNQQLIKPFCTKTFEHDLTGTVSFVEKVNPVTSRYEFLSIADDVFNLLLYLLGKYVIDDIGERHFMNYGVRHDTYTGHTFGPVLLDYPYVYKLDGRKLICNHMIGTMFGNKPCGGEIDYDAGFNTLYCTKCGREYNAQDLMQKNNDILIFDDEEVNEMIRAKIVSKSAGVIKDSGLIANNVIDEPMKNDPMEAGTAYTVEKSQRIKHEKFADFKVSMYSKLQEQFYKNIEKLKEEQDKKFDKMAVESITRNVMQPEEIKPVNYVPDEKTSCYEVKEVTETEHTFERYAMPEMEFKADHLIPEEAVEVDVYSEEVTEEHKDDQLTSAIIEGLQAAASEEYNSSYDEEEEEVENEKEESDKDNEIVDNEEPEVSDDEEAVDVEDSYEEPEEEEDYSNTSTSNVDAICDAITSNEVDFDEIKEVYNGKKYDEPNYATETVKIINEYNIDINEIENELINREYIVSDSETAQAQDDTLQESEDVEGSDYGNSRDKYASKKKGKKNKKNRRRGDEWDNY